MANCKLDTNKICKSRSKQKNSYTRKELEILYFKCFPETTKTLLKKKNMNILCSEIKNKNSLKISKKNKNNKYIKDKSIKKIKKNDKINHYYVYENDNIEEQYDNILKKAKKGDIVEFISQNMMGYKRYKVIGKGDAKGLQFIGDFEELF